MATSGTTVFTPTLDDIIEEAFERAGREPRSGYDFRTARRSLNLLLAEWANRGFNLWTIREAAIPLLQGVASYNLPADTIDIVEHLVRSSVTNDRYLQRMHLNTYVRLTDKGQQGFPTKILVKREVAHPVVTLWPVPDSGDYTLVYWSLRRMHDAGDASNTQDVPFRFVPALIAGLAFHIAQKIPEGIERLPFLEKAYEQAWELAAGEDRDRATVYLRPRIAG